MMVQSLPQQQAAFVEANSGTDSALQALLKNSRFSTCTDVQTLDSTPSLIADDSGLASTGFIHSILTRRLGLIVGCCLGILVFIVMISVLSYVKLKKQRIENAKRRAVLPPDYMSYRHFSIPNEDLLRSGTVLSTVPSGISAHISGTTTATATTPIGILKMSESLSAASLTNTPCSLSTPTATISGNGPATNLGFSNTSTLKKNDVGHPADVIANNHNHNHNHQLNHQGAQ